MKTIQLIKIIRKSLFKNNKGVLLYILCIILAMGTSLVLHSAAQSLIDTIFESKKEVYGKFTDIYYDSNYEVFDSFRIDSNYIKKKLPDFQYKEAGAFYTVYKNDEMNKIINLGYGDDKALQLGNITVIEGQMPQNDSEIALTKSVLHELGDKKLNDTIILDQDQYIITAIVADYGRLWAKGERQIKENTGHINAFVCKDKAMLIYQKYGRVYHQILFIRDSGVFNKSYDYDDLYYNVNAQMDKEDTIFSVPIEFNMLLFVSSVICIYSILFLLKENFKKRFKIYYQLGMLKSDIYHCFVLELVMMTAIGVILGGILSYLLSALVINYVGMLTGQTLIVNYSIRMMLWISLLICIAAFLAGTLILKQIFYVGETQIIYTRSKKYIKSTLIRLAFLEFRQNKNGVLLLILLISCCFTLIFYSDIYEKTFSIETAYLEVDGKMPFNYDYEFFTDIKNQMIRTDDDIYQRNSYELDGADATDVELLRQEPGVKQVLAYKEDNKAFILLPLNRMNLYLDASDFMLDGQYTTYTLEEEMRQLFDYNNLLIKTKFVGYPDNDILSFQQFVYEGEINLDKIKAGEEIILMVPAFTLKGSLMTPVSPDSEDAVNDTFFHAGDEIMLSDLVTTQAYNEWLNQSEVKSNIKRQDYKVKIGAIIRNYVGWFEKEATFDEQYIILVSDETFTKWGLPAKYNRIRVYAKEDTNMKKLTTVMNSYMEQFPNMDLDNLQFELESYRQLNFLIKIFTVIQKGLIIFVCMVSFISQMRYKAQINQRKYSLLRINGMNIKHIVKIWLLQVCVIGLFGILIGIPFSLFTVYQTFGISYSDVSKYISTLQFVEMLAIIISILFISLIPCYLYIQKHNLREGI